MDYKELAYSLDPFKDQLAKIGSYARKHNHRLTFHPGFFTILNTNKHFVLISVIRELYWHTVFLDLCGLDRLSSLTLHIGGIIDYKENAIQRFIDHFNDLPTSIKTRIIIENDENTFNVEDLLYISNHIKPYQFENKTIKTIPICLDYFHYLCYNINRQKKPEKYSKQLPLKTLIPRVLETWKGLRPKFHISEQAPDHILGTHSNYVMKIPKILLNLNIDLMIEAKCKEKATLYLINKYFPTKKN